MIVLDEHLRLLGVGEAISRWYPGAVVHVPSLRPGSVVKDEAIPRLLRAARQPTFVTINVTDFWGAVPADPRYCIVCVDLPHTRVMELPDALRRLLRLPEFRTKTHRLGKVVRVAASGVWYYDVGSSGVHFIAWPSDARR